MTGLGTAAGHGVVAVWLVVAVRLEVAAGRWRGSCMAVVWLGAAAMLEVARSFEAAEILRVVDGLGVAGLGVATCMARGSGRGDWGRWP